MNHRVWLIMVSLFPNFLWKVYDFPCYSVLWPDVQSFNTFLLVLFWKLSLTYVENSKIIEYHQLLYDWLDMMITRSMEFLYPYSLQNVSLPIIPLHIIKDCVWTCRYLMQVNSKSALTCAWSLVELETWMLLLESIY